MVAAALPAPSEAAAAHSAHLAGAIRAAIETSGGWMPFDRYMRMALYEPALGYYTAGAAKFGPAGDFVTAPELSPLFGRTLARQAADVLAELGGDILELGPGTGRLAHQILEELARLGPLPGSYQLLDISTDLRERQQQTLGTLPPALAGRVQWIDRLPSRFRGVIVANEVLDAVPVRLVSWSGEGLMERGVGLSGAAFTWVDRPMADPALRSRLERLRVPVPYVSEVAPEAEALVATLAESLEAGVLLLVDYGFGAAEFYHPQRSRGTLMCHYRHHAHDDPFHLPGLQDITAHVNFTAVAESAVAAGANVGGYTTQGHFLVNCGLTDLLAPLAGGDAAQYARIAGGVQKLVSPSEMGELFKVLAMTRSLPSPLRGFARGDLSRLL